MANQEHVDILRQGVEVWNAWREEHPGLQPDLNIANLRQANLSGINLRETSLMGANFSMANLQGANLSKTSLRGTNFLATNLRGANLSRTNLWDTHFWNHNIGSADLTNADLSYTELGGVDFSNVNLNGANLSGAYLGGVNLTNANLNESNFTDATLIGTSFGDRDLRVIKGLGTIKHRGPSPISINTIYLSGGDIPEIFMRGTGAPDIFIKYMHSLIDKPIEYYSCFISYSSKDEDFAQRLHNDLQGSGVRCWFDREDLKIGDKFWHRIDESIRLYDKLLVILSENSMESTWVENEVMAALEKERQQPGKTVLFPIKLDNTVMETHLPWAANMRRTRHIGDFTHWKEHDEYQKGLSRLLRDLKQEAIHDTIESDADQD